MKSKILIGTSESFRFAIADTSSIFMQILDNGKYSPPFAVPQLLLLNIVALMSSDIKGENKKITVVVSANGTLGNFKARIDGKGRVISNAYISNETIEKLDNSKTLEEYKKNFYIGDGVVKFEIDLGLKTPYYTELPIKTGDTVEDVVKSYYANSYQIDTILQTAADLETVTAGSLMIQKLPGGSDENFELIKDKIRQLHDVATLTIGGFTQEQIVQLIFEDIREDKLGSNIEDYKILEIRELEFKCDCTEEKFKNNILKACSRKEIDEMIRQDGFIEAICGFCDAYYRFKEV